MSINNPSGGNPLPREVAKDYGRARNEEYARQARGVRRGDPDVPGRHPLKRLFRAVFRR